MVRYSVIDRVGHPGVDGLDGGGDGVELLCDGLEGVSHGVELSDGGLGGGEYGGLGGGEYGGLGDDGVPHGFDEEGFEVVSDSSQGVVGVEGSSYEELGVGEMLSLGLDIGFFPHCSDSEVRIASHIRKVLGIIVDTSSQISSKHHSRLAQISRKMFEVSLKTTLILRLRKDTGNCQSLTLNHFTSRAIG
jgi:hypothetical protein